MAAVSRTSSNASSAGPPSPLIGSVYEQLPPLPPNLARLVSLAHTIAYWSVLLLDRYLTRVWEIFSLFLAFAGLREPIAENPRRRRSREVGEGLAVVIVGAKEGGSLLRSSRMKRSVGVRIAHLQISARCLPCASRKKDIPSSLSSLNRLLILPPPLRLSHPCF